MRQTTARAAAAAARSCLGTEATVGSEAYKSKFHICKLQVLATYRNQLREYRALQEELTPWTQAFQQRHGRKPRLVDVEHTGAPAVIRLVMHSLPTGTTYCLAGTPAHLAGGHGAMYRRASDYVYLCTGVEWLIAKYKCYLMMRERVVMDTPQLRSKLTSAKPGAGIIAVCVPWWCRWQMLSWCDYMAEESDRIRNRMAANICSACRCS